MKILHVISSVNPTGDGPIEGVRQLHAPMLAMRHEVDVVCCDDPSSPWRTETRLSKGIALGPAKLGYVYTPKLLPWLRENAASYSTVIDNGLWQRTCFPAWRALASTKTPYFVFTHGILDPWFKHTYTLKHLKKWLYWPWAEYRVALACGKPVLISNKVNIADDKAGLVGKDDVPGTISCLVRWLALSPQDYADMSVRAKQCFESRLQIQRAAERLVEINMEHSV